MIVPDLATYQSRFAEAQEQVRRLALRGGLLTFRGTPRPDWVRIDVFERACELATSQDEEIAWTDALELEMSRTNQAEYVHRSDEISAIRNAWLDEARDWALAFVPGPYADAEDLIGGDLFNFVCIRAAVGHDSWLFEQVWSALEAGGWPCGLEAGPGCSLLDESGKPADLSGNRLCVLWDPDGRTPTPPSSAAANTRRHLARKRREALLARFAPVEP